MIVLLLLGIARRGHARLNGDALLREFAFVCCPGNVRSYVMVLKVLPCHPFVRDDGQARFGYFLLSFFFLVFFRDLLLLSCPWSLFVFVFLFFLVLIFFVFCPYEYHATFCFRFFSFFQVSFFLSFLSPHCLYCSSSKSSSLLGDDSGVTLTAFLMCHVIRSFLLGFCILRTVLYCSNLARNIRVLWLMPCVLSSGWMYEFVF